MRETFDMMDFVDAAFALTGIVLAVLIGWSWRAMRSAEARRDAARGKRTSADRPE